MLRVGRLLRSSRVVDGQRRVHARLYDVVDETQPACEKSFRLARVILGSLLKIGLGHDTRTLDPVVSAAIRCLYVSHLRTSPEAATSVEYSPDRVEGLDSATEEVPQNCVPAVESGARRASMFRAGGQYPRTGVARQYGHHGPGAPAPCGAGETFG